MEYRKNMKYIGEMIQEARRKKGLSRRELAEKLGITISAISHWENNIRIPSAPEFIKAIQILDIVSEFFPDYQRTSPSIHCKNSRPDIPIICTKSLTRSELIQSKMDKLEVEFSYIKSEMNSMKNLLQQLVEKVGT